MANDEHYIKKALSLALKGRGFTSPNPMVGAVVVKNGEIVGKGFHEAVGKAHAEVNAIDDAGKNAKGADIYVTLEPCNHTGRTPPCTRKILEAGIRRVVIAMSDPNPDVRGGGGDFLIENGLDVVTGVLEDEARKQNEIFIKFIETKRPFVIVKCAATLDGRIATRTGNSKWISCGKSRQYVHELRHAVDGIMVGSGTVKNDDPSLTTRLDSIEGLDPVRIVPDTSLSVPENAKILTQDSDSETIIVTSCSAPQDKKEALERAGARIIESPLKDGMIDLDYLMGELGRIGITSLLIEGGSRLAASAFKAGVVDKINFFFAPKILGGEGLPICSGEGPAVMDDSIRVKNIRTERFDDDIMIEGYI